MSTLSALLADKAGPYLARVAGEARPVSYLTQAKKAEFEKWLKANAVAAVVEMRASMPPDVWQELYRVVIQDLAGKAYSFHGAVSQAALRGAAGALAFAAILFGVTEEVMMGLMERDADGVKAALDVVLADSTPSPNG